jgi:hypothetical protein
MMVLHKIEVVIFYAVMAAAVAVVALDVIFWRF